MILTKSIEESVINQLREYNVISRRIKLLEMYPIGYGMHITPTNDEDKLQDLHRKLKDMPSYMYLSKREQELETVAVSYLDEYPLGIRSQLRAVQRTRGENEEDKLRLIELRRMIKKIIEARAGEIDGFEGVVQRISELQDLEQQRDMIDKTLEFLNEYKGKYVELLKARYIENMHYEIVANVLNISLKTYYRWHGQAIEEYAKLAGMTKT